MTQRITESLGAAQRTGPGRVMLTIITPGQGSSGHYTPEMLAQAEADLVFPKGTLSMVNHPTREEAQSRPEGDLRNLAAVLLEDAKWEPDWVDPETGTRGRLAAEAKVGSAWSGFVDDFHEFIGASIYASAEVNESGEIQRLLPDPFNRVDLVTVAGRGGGIAEVLEAAKVIESRSVVQETTAMDVEMWLNSAIRDSLQTWGYVIDHDDNFVYYIADHDTEEQRTYRRSYTLSGSTVTLGSDPVEVRRRTEYDPITSSQLTPAEEPTNTQDQEGATMATIDDQELRELQEKAARVDQLVKENEELKAEIEELKDQLKAQAAESRREQALTAVHEAFGEDAPAFFVTAAETAAQAEDYDHEAFAATVLEAATATGANIAGTPHLGTVGHTVTTESRTITTEDTIAALEGRA